MMGGQNIMKTKYLIAALAFGAITFTSCSDFLDQKSKSELSGENVYENEYFTSLRINNIYGLLTTDRTYSQDMSVTFGCNTDIECIDGTYKAGTYNAASYRGWGNYYGSSFATDTKSNAMWTEFYGIIEQCNLIIDGIQNSKAYQGGSKALKHYLGEAYTLRAMVYLDLIRLFGDVPMKLEKSLDDLSNAYVGKTDRDVLMDQLIADLQKVIDGNMLPWVGESGYTVERVNMAYALGLQGQIALTRAGWAIRESAKSGYETATDGNSDPRYPTQRPAQAERNKYYKLALDNFNKIILSGKHSMEGSFHDYWSIINLRQYSNESIFEIPMGLNKSGEIGYSIGIRLNQQTSTFGYTNSTGHMNLTAKLFYDYGKNDTRRMQTCGFYQIRSTAGSNQTKSGTRKDNFIGNAPFGIPCGKWDPRMMSDEWLAINKNAEGKFGYGINFIKLRYPHVLLMYAEALNELTGDPDAVSYNGTTYAMSARKALLDIRERAYAGNTAEAQTYVNGITGKDNFFKAIVDENELELAGESVRKWDLIRWNLLHSKIMEMRTASINRQQTTPEGTTVIWDAKVAYNYLDAAKNIIDDSSWTWGENADNKSWNGTTYAELKATFGTVDADQTNNAKYYSSGLCGIDGGEGPAVKNLYLLPISNSAINASAGYLKNSYGY
jgi:hypothetical protein